MSNTTVNTHRVEHDPSLYFDDGDIVLAAPMRTSPAVTQMFRVGKYQLAHLSPVFCTMFSLPQPPGGELESYDGMQLVSVSDDAEDLAVLLDILHNPLCVTMSSIRQFLSHPHRSEPPFADVCKADLPLAVTPPLRLADKYDIESLRKRLVSIVVNQWPLTLDAWDKQREEFYASWPAGLPSDADSDDDEMEQDLHDYLPEPASAIAFAREFDCPEILPAAFYGLSINKGLVDWDHYDHDSEPMLYPARWSLLDAASWRTLYRGRIALSDHCVTERVALSFPPASPRHPGCLRPDRRDCPDAWRNTLLGAFDPLSWAHAYADLLEELRECGDKRAADMMCGMCRVDLRRWINAHRQELWDNLPRLFGLTTK